jgi:hypothetical protein
VDPMVTSELIISAGETGARRSAMNRGVSNHHPA